MSATGMIFSSCLFDTWRGLINFEGGRFGVMLLTADYVPDLRNHRRRSDISDEVMTEGYKEGGTKVSVALMDAADDDALDISMGGARWPRASINARYAVYYHDNGGSAEDDELIALIDFSENIVSTNGTFVLSESTLRVRNS